MRQIRLGDVQHHRCTQCDRGFRTWTRSFWLIQLGLLAATAALVSGAVQSRASYLAGALGVVGVGLVVLMLRRWKTSRDNPIRPA